MEWDTTRQSREDVQSSTIAEIRPKQTIRHG